MKIQELRQALSVSDRNNLEKALAETYKQHREITLYCALELIDRMEQEELWTKTYEYGLKQKIQPRDWLKAAYQEKINRLQKKDGK